MKRYRWQKWGGVLFLISMLIIGYAAIPLPGNEIFPFYSWTMFSIVPSEQVGYTVFIHELNGVTYNPPLEFRRANGLPIEIHSVVAYKVMQKMGAAYDAGNMKEFEGYRRLFESNYLPAGTHYELFRMKFDPLTEWKSGERTLEPIHAW